MEELDSSKKLPHDILLVHVLQNVCADHSMQIGFHVIKNKVYVPVILCLVN